MEALSGVDLPRGDGIKTRIPLVLRLREAANGDEFAELPQLGDDASDRAPIRIALDQISAAIETRTAELAGDSKDIVDMPVEMTVYRKDQDDLTLIDLPGMTRVAVEGQHQVILFSGLWWCPFLCSQLHTGLCRLPFLRPVCSVHGHGMPIDVGRTLVGA